MNASQELAVPAQSTIRRKPLAQALLHDPIEARTSALSNSGGFGLAKNDLFELEPLQPQDHSDLSQEISNFSAEVEQAFADNVLTDRLSSLAEQPSYTLDGGSSKDWPVLMAPTTVSDSQQRRPLRMWNSIWLSGLVLLGFAMLFATLLAALILVYHFSKTEHGFSTSLTANHYAWTYGPTAVFVFVSGLWNQVDHDSKILAPWKNLRGEGRDAKENILLDYLSPFLPVILIQSLRRQHWAVFLGSLTIVFLRILTVVSTGLIVRTPTTLVHQSHSIPVNSEFSGSDHFISSTLLPGVTYFGILEDSLPYPYGTTSTLAFDTVPMDGSLPTNSTITLTVNAFVPGLDCEIATVDTFFGVFGDADNGGEVNLNTTIRTESCIFYDVTYDLGWMLDNDSSTADYPLRVVRQGQYVTDDKGDACPSSAGNDFLLVIVDLVQTQIESSLTVFSANGSSYEVRASTINVASNETFHWSISVMNTSAVYCRANYSIESTQITIDTANWNNPGGVTVSEPLTTAGKFLDGYSSSDLKTQYFNAIDSGITAGTTIYLPNSTEVTRDPPFNFMTSTPSDPGNLGLLDPYYLQRSAVDSFKGVAAQIGNLALRKPIHGSNVDGAISYRDDRLQIKEIPLWIMVTTLGILILVPAVLFVTRSHDVVPRSPNTISSVSAIIAASPDLRMKFKRTGHLSDEELLRHATSSKYGSETWQTSRSSKFSITLTESDGSAARPPKGASKPAWWRPRAISSPFLVLLVLFPASLITILEVLQQRSDSYQGIASVNSSSSLSHTAVSFVPAFFMLVVALQYESLDFVVSAFAPYSVLRKVSVEAKRSISTNVLGMIAVLKVVSAARRRQFPVVIASISSILGSFLTIIVSGLYTLELLPSYQALTAQASDGFHISLPPSQALTPYPDGEVFLLIEQRNLSYPAYTFDELVFPKFSFSDEASSVLVDQAAKVDPLAHTLLVSIPATRWSLNCTPARTGDYVDFAWNVWTNQYSNATANTLDEGEYPVTMTFQADSPPGCVSNTVENDTSIFNYTLRTILSDLDGQFAGTIGDVDLITTGYLPSPPPNPPGCPSIGYMFGYFEWNKSESVNITSFACTLEAEELSTSTTFLLPNMIVDATHPPEVDELSLRQLGAYEFNGFIQRGLGASLTDFPQEKEETPAGYFPLDAFSQALILGPEGIPAEELLGPDNVPRLINATQHLFRKYMAQLTNNMMRLNVSDNDSRNGTSSDATAAATPQTFNTSLINSQAIRVVQHRASKITLQALLGAMIVGGIAAYSMTDMRHTLPHNPCSIAGVASLLADSELCESHKIIPDGAEFMSDKQLAAVFEGWLFSLGWFGVARAEEDGPAADPVNENGNARFGIDVGRAEKAK